MAVAVLLMLFHREKRFRQEGLAAVHFGKPIAAHRQQTAVPDDGDGGARNLMLGHQGLHGGVQILETGGRNPGLSRGDKRKQQEGGDNSVYGLSHSDPNGGAS